MLYGSGGVGGARQDLGLSEVSNVFEHLSKVTCARVCVWVGVGVCLHVYACFVLQ